MPDQTASSQGLVSALFQSNPPMDLILKVFFLNLGISVLVTLLIMNLIQLDIIKRKKSFALLSICIGAFIPPLGNIVVIIAVFLLKKYGEDFQPIEINLYPQVEYARKNPVKVVAYGTSWADVRLHSSNYSPEERNQALYSVSKGLPRDTNRIYSSLVSDDLEELRICAFSMLENQQDFLQKKINQFLKKYEEILEPKKKAFIAKQIALLYWELVYRNLADQEFRSILLEQSNFYANIALEILSDDTTLLILLSRINMENGQIKEGLSNLSMASKYNAPNSKIYPYLAELAYKKREYNTVKEYLCSDASFRYILRINKIVEFWCKK
ncbi:hypothetical protein [Legionella sp.]|uniref:hypothetical protein n=1 Tax=Legionella sp. TaxID=459 RepID=UPI0032204511